MTDPPSCRGACPPLCLPGWHRAPGLRPPSACALCWSRRGKPTTSSLQIPLSHHHSPPPSAAPVGGSHRGPRGPAPSSIQTRLSAPSIPRRLHIPKTPTCLPKPPGTSTESGTLSTPRASPGPSLDPAPSHQGSPVLMNWIPIAGLTGEGSPGTRGASWATLRLHLRPGGAGRGRERRLRLPEPRGKGRHGDSGATEGLGLRAPPGRVAGCELHPKEGLPALLEPPARPRGAAALAPKAEVTANLVPGLPPPRARCGHGQGGDLGALRYRHNGKRPSTGGGW